MSIASSNYDYDSNDRDTPEFDRKMEYDPEEYKKMGV